MTGSIQRGGTMTPVELTGEKRLFRDPLHKFARKEIAPLVDEAEETNTLIQRRVIAREEGY